MVELKCRYCGQPLIHEESNLYHCKYCDIYFRLHGGELGMGLLRSQLLPRTEKEQFTIIAKEEKPAELAKDQITFVNRVAERLAPTTGYIDDAARARAKTQQDRIRRELTEVFQGREDISKWFDRTKSDLSLRPYDLTLILYQCLEGLKDPGARELRQKYEQELTRLAAEV